MAAFVPYIAPFTRLHDIAPYKTSWRIQVKILHTWQNNNPFTGETTEMIFADTFGTLIHASIKREELPKFQGMISSGEWLIIQNFSLIKATGMFRPTKHLYKMAFMNTTTIMESANISNDIYLDLESYEDIADSEALNENILIDVIGQVVIVSEMETLILANKATKKLEVELRDTNNSRLNCTLWGNYADTMWDACQNVGNNIVVGILRFAKINSYAGHRTVSSAYDISMLLINPIFPEAHTFRGNLPLDGLTITIKKQLVEASSDAFDNGGLEDGKDKTG